MKTRRFNPILLNVLIISAVAHGVGLLGLGAITLYQVITEEEPEFEAPMVVEAPEPPPPPVSINRLTKKSSMSAAPVITVTQPSQLNLPTANISVPKATGRTGMGRGFGGGLDMADMLASAPTISFFGVEGSGERFAFIVDFSSSMNKQGTNRSALMRTELLNSLESLPDTAMVSVLAFAGPVWNLGENPKEAASDFFARANAAGELDFNSYEFKNAKSPPSPKWMPLTSSNRRDLEKAILETPTVLGTVWDLPFQMLFGGDDDPDVVFFMTDGGVGGDSNRGGLGILEILENRKKSGRPVPVVNTIGLEVDSDNQKGPLIEIAEETGGQATFIDDGKAYAANKKLVDYVKVDELQSPRTGVDLELR